MVDAGVQIPLDALARRACSLSRSTTVVRPPVKGRDVGSTPTGTASKSLYKNVLLGEQPVSKAGGVGSNPTVLAQGPVKRLECIDPAVYRERRVRFPYRALVRAGDRAARQPSDTRFEVGSTPTGPTR